MAEDLVVRELTYKSFGKEAESSLLMRFTKMYFKHALPGYKKLLWFNNNCRDKYSRLGYCGNNSMS